jgi:hypothetical protein
VRVEKLRAGAENGTLAGTASARAAADQ